VQFPEGYGYIPAGKQPRGKGESNLTDGGNYRKAVFSRMWVQWQIQLIVPTVLM